MSTTSRGTIFEPYFKRLSISLLGLLIVINYAEAAIDYAAIRNDTIPKGTTRESARTTRNILEELINKHASSENKLQHGTEHLLQYGALLRTQILDTFGKLVYDHYDDFSMSQIEALYRVYQETLERKYNIFDIVPSVLEDPDTRPTKICAYINEHIRTCLKESSRSCMNVKIHDEPHEDTLSKPILEVTRKIYESTDIPKYYPQGFSPVAVLDYLRSGKLRFTPALFSGLLHNVQYDSFDDKVRTAERELVLFLTKSPRKFSEEIENATTSARTLSELLKKYLTIGEKIFTGKVLRSANYLSEHVIREVDAISENIELLGTVYDNSTINLKYLFELILPNDSMDRDVLDARDYLLHQIQEKNIVENYLRVEKYQQAGPDQLLMEIFGQLRDIHFAEDLVTSLYTHARFWHKSHMIENLNELLELFDAYENLRGVPEYRKLLKAADRIKSSLADWRNVTVELLCSRPRTCLLIGLKMVRNCDVVDAEIKGVIDTFTDRNCQCSCLKDTSNTTCTTEFSRLIDANSEAVVTHSPEIIRPIIDSTTLPPDDLVPTVTPASYDRSSYDDDYSDDDELLDSEARGENGEDPGQEISESITGTTTVIITDCEGSDCTKTRCIGPDCVDSSCEDENCLDYYDCEGPDCFDSSCEGEDCQDDVTTPGACKGSDCETDSGMASVCEGSECEDDTKVNSAGSSGTITCEGPNCRTTTCVGNNCENNGTCEGDNCQDKAANRTVCQGPDCEDSSEVNSAGSTEKKPCQGLDCPAPECVGKDCGVNMTNLACKGPDCGDDTEVNSAGSIERKPCEGLDCPAIDCVGKDCGMNTTKPVCKGLDCEVDSKINSTDSSETMHCQGLDCPVTDCVGKDCGVNRTELVCKGPHCDNGSDVNSVISSDKEPCQGLDCPVTDCVGKDCVVNRTELVCKGEKCQADSQLMETNVTEQIQCEGRDCAVNKTSENCEGSDCVTRKEVTCEGDNCPNEPAKIDCETSDCSDSGGQLESEKIACMEQNCTDDICKGIDCLNNSSADCRGFDCTNINCTGADCVKNDTAIECEGLDCFDNSTLDCEGPDCPKSTCTGPNCVGSGTSIDCEGSACPGRDAADECVGSNCPLETSNKTCFGLNCSLNITNLHECKGSDCSEKKTEENCNGLDCSGEGNEDEPNCDDDSCSDDGSIDASCEGGNCESNFIQNATDSAIEDECYGEDCKENVVKPCEGLEGTNCKGNTSQNNNTDIEIECKGADCHSPVVVDKIAEEPCSGENCTTSPVSTIEEGKQTGASPAPLVTSTSPVTSTHRPHISTFCGNRDPHYRRQLMRLLKMRRIDAESSTPASNLGNWSGIFNIFKEKGRAQEKMNINSNTNTNINTNIRSKNRGKNPLLEVLGNEASTFRHTNPKNADIYQKNSRLRLNDHKTINVSEIEKTSKSLHSSNRTEVEKKKTKKKNVSDDLAIEEIGDTSNDEESQEEMKTKLKNLKNGLKKMERVSSGKASSKTTASQHADEEEVEKKAKTKSKKIQNVLKVNHRKDALKKTKIKTTIDKKDDDMEEINEDVETKSKNMQKKLRKIHRKTSSKEKIKSNIRQINGNEDEAKKVIKTKSIKTKKELIKNRRRSAGKISIETANDEADGNKEESEEIIESNGNKVKKATKVLQKESAGKVIVETGNDEGDLKDEEIKRTVDINSNRLQDGWKKELTDKKTNSKKRQRVNAMKSTVETTMDEEDANEEELKNMKTKAKKLQKRRKEIQRERVENSSAETTDEEKTDEKEVEKNAKTISNKLQKRWDKVEKGNAEISNSDTSYEDYSEKEETKSNVKKKSQELQGWKEIQRKKSTKEKVKTAVLEEADEGKSDKDTSLEEIVSHQEIGKAKSRRVQNSEKEPTESLVKRRVRTNLRSRDDESLKEKDSRVLGAHQAESTVHRTSGKSELSRRVIKLRKDKKKTDVAEELPLIYQADTREDEPWMVKRRFISNTPKRNRKRHRLRDMDQELEENAPVTSS